jgi:hypothetical protein
MLLKGTRKDARKTYPLPYARKSGLSTAARHDRPGGEIPDARSVRRPLVVMARLSCPVRPSGVRAFIIPRPLRAVERAGKPVSREGRQDAGYERFGMEQESPGSAVTAKQGRDATRGQPRNLRWAEATIWTSFRQRRLPPPERGLDGDDRPMRPWPVIAPATPHEAKIGLTGAGAPLQPIVRWAPACAKPT